MFAQVDKNAIGGSVEAAYRMMSTYLPQLVGALAILVVGWIGVVLVAAMVRGILRRAPVWTAVWPTGSRPKEKSPSRSMRNGRSAGVSSGC